MSNEDQKMLRWDFGDVQMDLSALSLISTDPASVDAVVEAQEAAAPYPHTGMPRLDTSDPYAEGQAALEAVGFSPKFARFLAKEAAYLQTYVSQGSVKQRCAEDEELETRRAQIEAAGSPLSGPMRFIDTGAGTVGVQVADIMIGGLEDCGEFWRAWNGVGVHVGQEHHTQAEAAQALLDAWNAEAAKVDTASTSE